MNVSQRLGLALNRLLRPTSHIEGYGASLRDVLVPTQRYRANEDSNQAEDSLDLMIRSSYPQSEGRISEAYERYSQHAEGCPVPCMASGYGIILFWFPISQDGIVSQRVIARFKRIHKILQATKPKPSNVHS
ncbi:hypothetical protein TrVFT333_001706 [Trichoderma virens FT-333]|nr:hypothetical protein TrVFT333_001706 [Trichoderma virens FT-333]